MGYATYYIALMLASYVLRYPPLLLAVVVFFVLQRFLPDPWVWLKTMGRMSSLGREIAANPANATARRDLARIYLEQMRPGAAITLLDEAEKRFPDDAELLFLGGAARVRKRRYEEALPKLVRAVEIDSRVRFGEPFLIAGDALRQLGRDEEALDAYQRYAELSSSSIEGHVKVASVQRALGNSTEARTALEEALATWRQIPGYSRRKQLGWWLRAQAMRVII